jgi:hypothetical protein
VQLYIKTENAKIMRQSIGETDVNTLKIYFEDDLMACNKLLIFYLFVCNVSWSSAIIYACNQTADCGCSKANANVHKIVGGEDAFPFSWGWAVSLQDPSDGHFCTGAIVSPLHIITAAHCFTDATNIETTNVVVGINQLSDSDNENAQVRSVSAVFAHPGYNHSTQLHDIAVLRLNESLDISDETVLARLCLPRIEPSGKEVEYPVDAVLLVAIGWGILRYGDTHIPPNLYLQQVTVEAVPFRDETCTEFVTNSSVQFCAGVSGGGKGKKVHFHNVIELYFVENQIHVKEIQVAH